MSFRINSTVDCTNIGFEVISDSFTTDDLIEFKSTVTSGVEWEWNFGDKSGTMFRSNVLHQFKKPGKYTISLSINGQCVTTEDIAISERKQLIDQELVPNIILPQSIRVGEEVEFSSDAQFAESWQWSFGESMVIDGTSEKERYTFKKPGKKTVLLVVNGDRRHEAKQSITVLEAFRERRKRNTSKRIDPIETVLRQQIIDKPIIESKNEEKEKKKPEQNMINRIEVSEDELHQLFVGYSNRRLDDTSIREYFCYSNIPVFNKTGDRFTVSQFFNEIRDVKLELNSIRLIRDHKTGCVKSMTVDMKTKKGLFWKKF